MNSGKYIAEIRTLIRLPERHPEPVEGRSARDDGLNILSDDRNISEKNR